MVLVMRMSAKEGEAGTDQLFACYENSGGVSPLGANPNVTSTASERRAADAAVNKTG